MWFEQVEIYFGDVFMEDVCETFKFYCFYEHKPCRSITKIKKQNLNCVNWQNCVNLICFFKPSTTLKFNVKVCIPTNINIYSVCVIYFITQCTFKAKVMDTAATVSGCLQHLDACPEALEEVTWLTNVNCSKRTARFGRRSVLSHKKPQTLRKGFFCCILCECSNEWEWKNIKRYSKGTGLL